jgi:hypothetical protein
MPSTSTTPGCGSGSPRSRFKSVSRLAVMPSAAASRAPARPANATAIAVNAPRSGGLYRACGVVNPGTCSTNVRRRHDVASQPNRRTASRMTTGVPASGASRSTRS